jgi:hypothetical protein
MRNIALMLALAWSLQPIAAMERGTTDLGVPFVSGGVGTEEVATLSDERKRYTLAILTAAKNSGAFLADVRIRISDARLKLVFDTVMDGPWLLIDLPAGSYEIEATQDSRVQKKFVTFTAGDHRQTVFYFDTHDQVENERSSNLVTDERLTGERVRP